MMAGNRGADMPPRDARPPAGEVPAAESDQIALSSDLQLRAISNVVRHRILAFLLSGPATIAQISEAQGLLKGSTSYHLRILQDAGLVQVVSTRKVRGVQERTYGRTAKKLVLPDPGAGQPDIVMRNALADLESAPADSRLVELRHLRLDDAAFDELATRLRALTREFSARSTPDSAAADVAIMLYRPVDRPLPSTDHSS
ncbi:hypothetical protein Are01nite_64910 [Actinoplanes regularis]|nr:hypothetical protein Are01nite_64910 [Actinoplanes regularis]